MRYRFGVGSHVRGDAQQIGTALEAIEKRDGSIGTRAVVKDARERSSPLHPLFEWDDKAAADKFRLVQAQRIIVSIVLEPDPEDEQQFAPVRAFVCVTDVKGHEAGQFVRITAAVQDEDSRDLMLANARRELNDFRRRYKALSEFADLFAAIEAALA